MAFWDAVLSSFNPFWRSPLGKRRASARFILRYGRPYCAEGYCPAASFPVRERWLSSSPFPAIPSMRRWTSSRWKGICSVTARERGWHSSLTALSPGHCRTLPSGSPGGSACCQRPCPGTRRCWRLPREPRLSTIFRYRCGGDCTIA